MGSTFNWGQGGLNVPAADKADQAARDYLNKQAAAKRAGNSSASAADYRIAQQDKANMVASAVALAGGPVPGNFKVVPKATAAPKAKAKAKAPAKAVARRVGVPAARGPVAAPVDPLDTLRGEYDKYLTDIYGGLNTSLEGIRTQYKTRSEELAARLKGIYDDSASVAGSTAQRSNDDMTAFAERMGLGAAMQGRDTADWQQTNERLKSLNEVNRANSAATNDTIRTNYYDFLGDKVSSAKGQEAMSRGTLNDIIVQAKLARQQAQMAAAAAAARARSSRGRGGGGGSGGVKGTTSETTSTTNDELHALLMKYPDALNAAMSTDTITSNILRGGQSIKSPGFGVPGSAASKAMHASYALGTQTKKDAEALAKAYYIATGKTGGAKTASKYSQTSKGVA